ncbi:MAG: nucleotidyltransferase domain-containing protein [candidate division WOR-3 bacterium]
MKELKAELNKLYGRRLRRIVLYGSWAMGDATRDSDLDIIVVLGGRVSPGREIDRMIDALTGINLKYGVLISVYPVSEKNYYSLNSPLLINARKEGVLV